LKHDDYYKFTVTASGGPLNRNVKPSLKTKTFTVDNVQGNYITIYLCL